MSTTDNDNSVIARRGYYHVRSTDKKRPRIDIKTSDGATAVSQAVMWVKRGRQMRTIRIVEELIDVRAVTEGIEISEGEFLITEGDFR